MNKEKTVLELQSELTDLVNQGLGERKIYETVEFEGNKKVIPFNKHLIVPTVLEKALTCEDLDENQHIIFVEEALA